jgi:hypothetical protein
MGSSLFAAPVSSIHIKTILASQGSTYVDPQLNNLVGELRSVFRYTNYRLLSENRIRLQMGQSGTVGLPGNRILKITPSGIRGKRAELNLLIFRKNRLIFQTSIRLLNRKSITLGGPRHKKGILLLNIFISF